MAVLVELRRHSLTKKGAGRGAGSQLSQEGVALAAREGARGPRFSKVFASPIARTSETAIAMGFAVTDILPELGALEAVQAEVGFHAQWAWEQPFARFREFVERGGASAALGQAILQSIHRAVADVPEGESVLFVSHGSALEIALVTALPDADHASWGRSFSHCEGARLVLEGGAFQLQELLRLPSAG